MDNAAVRIAVALRLMPNAGDELELDPDGTDIDRDVVEMVINEIDEQALEEAVLIKEATGATVTAVALAAEGAEQALRVAYARGADRVVLVDAGPIDSYDTRTAARAFVAAIRELKPDLVLTGVQTPADVFGQAAPYIAAELGWPQASVVVGVKLEGRAVHVTQEYAGGRLGVLSIDMPAVVGVQSASAPTRYISMARLRQAMTEANTEPLNAAVERLAGGAEVTGLAPPAVTVAATMLDGDAAAQASQILALLNKEGALVG